MKVLSYNLYGVKDTTAMIPKWELRQKNIEKILNHLLTDKEIMVCCFQEANEFNIELLNAILENNGFSMLDLFPMKTASVRQYNILAIKNDESIKINKVYCLPHGKDLEYQQYENQVIDYDMSDYRTTVFVHFELSGINYLIGNIHTDYISTEGKIKGVVKSLNSMDMVKADYKMIVGDMNMVSHMSEVYQILMQNSNYTTVSRSLHFDIFDQSWHGYGQKEQVNVDFAFVEHDKKDCYEYEIIKQKDMFEEGSDHRPVMITIQS